MTPEPAGQSAANPIAQRWYASNYFDTDETGLVTEDNRILIRLSANLPRSILTHIAEVHNRWLETR